MNKIYVASSWRNDIQPQVVNALRLAGYEVYDFKNPRPGNHGFHWSEIDPNWKNWTPQEFIKCLSHPIAECGFASDMTALRECDICVLVLPCGRSAHLEAGWAAGAGKKVFILIPEEIEPELMYKMTDGQCTDINELVVLIEQHEKRGAQHLLDALNSLDVEDVSCSVGELEYVLAEITAKNIETLLNAGFIAEQIDEAMGDDRDCIDLTTLAQYTGANHWSPKDGFVILDEQRCRVCGCTQNNACPGSCYWVEDDLCSKCAEAGALTTSEP